GVKCEVTEYFVSETETTTMAAAMGESSSSEVAEYFVSKTDTTTAAEGTLAFHSITHHNSYRSMDCTSGLLRKVFTDSVTAQSAEGDSVHPVQFQTHDLQGFSYLFDR